MVKSPIISPYLALFPKSKAQRQLLYVRGEQPYLLIVDDFQTKDEAINEYTWLLHTDTNNVITAFPDEQRAQIVGSKRGALCDVTFLWPQNKVKVEESDLTEARLPKRNREGEEDEKLAAHFKELNAKTLAKNPYFVTILVARVSNTEKLIITTKGNAGEIDVKIEFSNRTKEVVNISSEFMEFNRNMC